MNKPNRRRAVLTLGLVFLLLLALAIPALAVKPPDSTKLQRLGWYAVLSGTSDFLSTDRVPGHVIIATPIGRPAMVINGHIALAPNSRYGVWVRQLTGYTGDYLATGTDNYYKLATFTTNGRGRGHFHIAIDREDLPGGTRSIQIAVNTSAADADVGSTVAATVKFTPITTR